MRQFILDGRSSGLDVVIVFLDLAKPLDGLIMVSSSPFPDVPASVPLHGVYKCFPTIC